MTITLDPIHNGFGVEISGLDLTGTLSDADRDAVVAALNRHGVAVIRDSGLDDAGHVAFSRIFGPLEQAPNVSNRRARFSLPELFDASNLDADGNINADPMLRLHRRGDRLWHTDASFKTQRATHSLLLAHETPPSGGDTSFADMRGAYDALPQDRKDQIADLKVVHSLFMSRMLAGYPLTEEEIDAKPSATHPLVHVHPVSGRKSLYVASHARDIVGWSREEGRSLLRELIEFATQPQFVFSHSWSPGDLVIWDNLSTMHRGTDYDDANCRRDMRRTTVHETAEAA